MLRSSPVAFLDRDGSLIDPSVARDSPRTANGTVAFAEGATHACGRLRGLGFLLVMVTNQPDVARGAIDREAVEIDNQQVADHLGLDLVVACMHDDLDRCNCRMPRPGLLYEAASTLGAHLDRTSVMIGDRWRGMEAGNSAGVTTILLDRGYGENLNTTPDYVASNLLTASTWIEEHLVMKARVQRRRF